MRNRLPELLPMLTPPHRRTTRRRHRKTSSSITSSTLTCSHRNSSLSRCCDDRLNSPNICRSDTRSGSPNPGSSPRLEAGAIPMTTRWPNRDRPVQDRDHSKGRPVEGSRRCRVRHSRLGILVQRAAAPGTDWRHTTGRIRTDVLSAATVPPRRGGTQLKLSPENPGRFNQQVLARR